MLTYWIPEGPCMLPANASHQVGIGGFVINQNNEVLFLSSVNNDILKKLCKELFQICLHFFYMISKQFFLSNLIHASTNFCIISSNKFVKVLVVQEKHCSPATLGLWKIPTGFIHEVCMLHLTFLNAQ